MVLVPESEMRPAREELTEATAIPYDEIPGFARATVEGHAGQLVIGKAGDVTVAAMQFADGEQCVHAIFRGLTDAHQQPCGERDPLLTGLGDGLQPPRR